MKPVCSEEELLSFLEQDLAWRKKELSKLVLVCDETNEKIISKSALLILYSHWEGYIKNAFKQYLAFVASRELDISTLSINFQAIQLKGLISEVFKSSETLTLKNELNLLEILDGEEEKLFKLNVKAFGEKDKSVINTRDNLSVKVLNSLLDIVGLGRFDALKSREKYLNEEFLNQRNSISHGNTLDTESTDFELSMEDVKKLRNLIFLLIDHIKDELSFFAENNLFLKENYGAASLRNKTVNQKIEKSIAEMLT